MSTMVCASLGSTEEPYDSDMTHSYRLTEGRLIRYPLCPIRVNGLEGSPFATVTLFSKQIEAVIPTTMAVVN